MVYFESYIPSEEEMATLYAGLRNGDSVKQVCNILEISPVQFDYWMTIGKRAEIKKKENDTLEKFEKECLKLKKLVDTADIRRRGW